jgi:hypothetical protein
MVPLISSLAYGPLGACQLPRTWWKALTRNAGILDDEYPDMTDNGLDPRVLRALNLDIETTLAYLRENMPSYLEFEAWILEQRGDDFWGFEQQDAIVRWNAFIRARRHRSDKIEETYTDTGLPRDAGIDSATVLNSLQDLQLFYKRDLSKLNGNIVPLVATIDFGPLGVRQLPRTWYKILLRAKGLLHPDYPDMTESGLDPRVLHALNLDIDATLNYIRTNLPSYLEFEGWVLEQCGGQIPSQAVDEWNDYLCNRIHNDAKRAEIRATVGCGDISSAVVLNHIEDWHLAHQWLLSAV